MRLLVYVPQKSALADRWTTSVDKDFPEASHVVEYATDEQDFAGLLKTNAFDAALVFVDGSLKSPCAFLQGADLSRLDGPLVCLHQNATPHTLFTILGHGCVSATAFSDQFVPGTVHALVRNAYYSYGGRARIKEYGPLRIDFLNKSCTIDGASVHFTPQEFEVLTVLAERPGRVCTKEGIHGQLYQMDEDVEMKIIDVFVHKVRKKLKDAAPDHALDLCIETVWGQGYKFMAPGERTRGYTLTFGPLRIDYTGQTATIDAQPLDLTIGEFMVLKTLAYEFPNPVPAEVLALEASKFGREAEDASVARYVYSLGRKLVERGEIFDRMILNDPDGRYFLNLTQVAPKIATALASDVKTLGPIRANLTIGEVTFKGKRLDLTSRETDILTAFMESYPGLITIEALAENVYGDASKTSALIPTFQKLRTKLTEANGGIDVIATRRRLGYMLDIQDRRLQEKVAGQMDVLTVGQWTVNATRAEISVKGDDGKDRQLKLARQPYMLLKAILEAYPKALTRADALSAVYGEDVADKDASLRSLFSQLKLKLDTADVSGAGSFRKIKDALFRIDLPPEHIASDTLAACSVTEIGAWAVNHTLQQVSFDGTPIALNDSEYFTVELMAITYPEPIPAETLAEMLFDGNKNSLNTSLTNLRKKVREEFRITDPLMRNIRGIGYVLCANTEELSASIIDSFKTADVGEAQINLSLAQVRFGSVVIPLNAAELFVLDALAHADAPLSTADIAAQSDGRHSPESITSALYGTLPKKLSDNGIEEAKLFENYRNIGYILKGRREHIVASSEIEEFKNLRLNHTLQELTVEGFTVDLTPAEYTLLKTMIAHPRVPLSAESMTYLMLEDDTVYADSTIVIAKNSIERKLKEAGVRKPEIITTRHGVGYYLTCMENDLNRSRLEGIRPTTLTDESVIRLGQDLVLNIVAEAVTYKGERLEKIEGKVFDLLCMFAKRHRTLVTLEDMANHLFADMSAEKGLRNAELGMKGLRHSLERAKPGLADVLIREFKLKKDVVAGYTLALEEDDYKYVRDVLKGRVPVSAPAAAASQPVMRLRA